MGEHLTFSLSIAVSMAIVLVCLWLVVQFGPEATGLMFAKPKPEAAVSA